MRLLAIEAATATVSLALGEGERVIERDIPQGQNASEHLTEAIVALLGQAGCALADLDGLVLGTGPGSLTGLRVAHATAKGLAYALRIPAVGISSLEALAFDAPAGPAAIVPAIDARRGELFAGIFTRTASDLTVHEPALALSAAALAERCKDLGQVRVVGPAAALLQPALDALGAPYEVGAPLWPRARALLHLCPALPAYDPAALFALEPRYVRAPEAMWSTKPKAPRAAPTET